MRSIPQVLAGAGLALLAALFAHHAVAQAPAPTEPKQATPAPDRCLALARHDLPAAPLLHRARFEGIA